MAIHVIVQYSSGFVPDILLLTQAPIVVWFEGNIIVYYYYPFNYVLHCLLFFLFGGLHGDQNSCAV